MSKTESGGIKEAIPYVVIMTVAFTIAGFVMFALFNGLTNTVVPDIARARWDYRDGGLVIILGWLAAFVVTGAATGFYIGRK